MHVVNSMTETVKTVYIQSPSIFPIWIMWVIGISTIVTAITILYKSFTTTAKLIGQLDDIVAAIPTLVTIAEQFKNNGGSTLKDSLDRIVLTIENHEKLIDRLLAHNKIE